MTAGGAGGCSAVPLPQAEHFSHAIRVNMAGGIKGLGQHMAQLATVPAVDHVELMMTHAQFSDCALAVERLWRCTVGSAAVAQVARLWSAAAAVAFGAASFSLAAMIISAMTEFALRHGPAVGADELAVKNWAGRIAPV